MSRDLNHDVEKDDWYLDYLFIYSLLMMLSQ